jgi:hypothetical protein
MPETTRLATTIETWWPHILVILPGLPRSTPTQQRPAKNKPSGSRPHRGKVARPARSAVRAQAVIAG